MQFDRLTAQERQCLILLDTLGSAQQVATHLGLALSTVYNHHQHAMKKLGAPSAARAAQLLVRHLAEDKDHRERPSESSSGNDSRLGQPSFAVISADGITTPPATSAGAGTLREERVSFDGIWSTSPASLLDYRPWRGKGERDSRLSAGAKLGWIVGAACLLAITVLVLVSVGASLTLIHQ